MTPPTTALIFLGSLGLRLISKGRVVGLSLVFVLGSLALGLSVGVFLVLGRRARAFWAPSVDVLNIKGRLQVSFCSCLTCLLHNFLPAI